jgi:branched-chain amino acid transport system ATP-binding protein
MHFGSFHALENVSFSVSRGDSLGILGPNGAGKTTLANCLSGLYSPNKGEILLDGRRVDRMRQHQPVHRGLSRTFQTIEHFNHMTVLDLVLLGRLRNLTYTFAEAAALMPRVLRQERTEVGAVHTFLEELGLSAVANVPLHELPYGYRKRADLARALASGPRVLLLDEPAAGIGQHEKAILLERLGRARDSGVQAIILIEHDMDFVREVCDTVIFLNFGRLLVGGPPEEVLRHPEVRAAYLGDES